MYRKKVLILNEVNNRFAVLGQHICGMVRITASESGTELTVFVTNVNRNLGGKWYLAVKSREQLFVNLLPTLNNFQYSLPLTDIDNIACVVANIDCLNGTNVCSTVCQATLGLANLDGLNSRSIEDVVNRDSSRYEQLLAMTDNYYNFENASDIARLSAGKYQSVQQYSSAFERYYATSRDDNYYSTVKDEVSRLLVQFPPYHPLISYYNNSYFVRIDFVNSNNYFAMGVIQRGGLVKYLCYALPSSDQKFHDKDFTFIDVGKGYYVLYQDATTGQITSLLA